VDRIEESRKGLVRSIRVVVVAPRVVLDRLAQDMRERETFHVGKDDLGKVVDDGSRMFGSSV
jgi:hypothetical protein